MSIDAMFAVIVLASVYAFSVRYIYQSRTYAKVLGDAGMVVRVVSDPLEVLAGIETFRPDLILMDLYLPSATGIELTRIIHTHEVHADIPIIFLSAEDDLDMQLDALRKGGDPDQLTMLDTLAIRLAKVPLNRLAHAGHDALVGPIARLRERCVAVIAAGVEDADTLALVWSIRPDYVQGNYLQMPSAELALEQELQVA